MWYKSMSARKGKEKMGCLCVEEGGGRNERERGEGGRGKEEKGKKGRERGKGERGRVEGGRGGRKGRGGGKRERYVAVYL